MSGLQITCRKSGSASDVQAKLCSYRILYSHCLCWTWLFNSIFVLRLDSSWKYPPSWRTRALHLAQTISLAMICCCNDQLLLMSYNKDCEWIHGFVRFNFTPKDFYVTWYENSQNSRLCKSTRFCSLTKMYSNLPLNGLNCKNPYF